MARALVKTIDEITEYEVKTLSANVTSNQVLTDLTYNGTIGDVIRIHFIQKANVNGTDGIYETLINDGGTVIGIVRHSDTTATVQATQSFSTVRTMTSSTISFNASSASANAFILGDGTLQQTHVIIEKLKNHVAA